MTIDLAVVDPQALALGLAALKIDRAEAEALLDGAQAWAPDVARAVGGVLVEALRTHDALKAERDRVVNPIYRAYKNASETYAPHLVESEAVCRALKAALGAYELAQRAVKTEALAAAQTAVQAPPTPEAARALTEALDVVNQPTGRADGVGTRFVWQVKRYVPEMMVPSTLDLPGLVPDESAIGAYARRWTGPDAPVVPGVVFEQVAQTTVRRHGTLGA